MSSAIQADAAAPAFRIVRGSKDRPKDPPRYQSKVENWELDCGALLLTGTIQSEPSREGAGRMITLHINDSETTLDDAVGIVCDFYAQVYNMRVARLAPRDIYIDDNDGLGLVFHAGVFTGFTGSAIEASSFKPPRLAGG